jgi:hypothetical protein
MQERNYSASPHQTGRVRNRTSREQCAPPASARSRTRRSRSGRCHRRSLRRSWEDRLLRKPGCTAGKPRASCVDMSMPSWSFDRPVGQTVQLGIAVGPRRRASAGVAA